MAEIAKKLIALFILAFALQTDHSASAGQKHTITIHTRKVLGTVNEMVFGTNLIGYDPTTYEDWPGEYTGYSDFGAGIWVPSKNEPAREVVELARNARAAVMRFPGGCGTHKYDWRQAVGKDRKKFLFGIEEFLQVCEAARAVPVFTISYFTGDEHEAAALVEYLNGRINYFEIGNEDWHGDHRKIKSVSPKEYAQRYLKYYAAIKKVQPGAQIGAILCLPEWDRKVMEIIKDNIDFGIVHMYPDPGVGNAALPWMRPEDIFSKTLGRINTHYERVLKDTAELLKEKAGKPVPLAITEYNAGFVQQKPVPYRHCLGSALVNADFLRILMKPENKILMANYWQFCNSYWGMVYARQDYMKHDPDLLIEYVKRPNYYVYALYKEHFGTELIEADAGKQAGDLSVNASKSSDGNTVYLMVVNKNMRQAVTASIGFDDFSAASKASAWVLNADSVDATNEDNPQRVSVKEKEIHGSKSIFTVTFPPHSLTALAFHTTS